MRYQFLVTRWDETGNILEFSKLVTVKRATYNSAYNFIRKKYHLGEFFDIELNTIL